MAAVGSEDEMELVTVHTAADRVEAETIAALLRSHGITVYVEADDAAGTGPNLAFVQGVPVKVAAPHADDAHRILELG